MAQLIVLKVDGDDGALSLSRVLGGGYERAGSYSTGSDPIVIDGVDTIDTTLVSADALGHADYVRSLANDLRGVVWLSLAPEARCILTDQSTSESRTYWAARPDAVDCSYSAFGAALQAVRSSRTTGVSLGEDEMTAPIQAIARATGVLEPEITSLAEKIGALVD